MRNRSLFLAGLFLVNSWGALGCDVDRHRIEQGDTFCLPFGGAVSFSFGVAAFDKVVCKSGMVFHYNGNGSWKQEWLIENRTQVPPMRHTDPSGCTEFNDKTPPVPRIGQ